MSRLKAEAAKKEVVLAEKQEEANRALQLITDTMKNANAQKVQMEALKEQALTENKKITERWMLHWLQLFCPSPWSKGHKDICTHSLIPKEVS